MPINSELVRWATVLDNDGVNGSPNRFNLTTQFKDSGLKRQQQLPRQFLNEILYQQGQAIIDLQNQITALTARVDALESP